MKIVLTLLSFWIILSTSVLGMDDPFANLVVAVQPGPGAAFGTPDDGLGAPQGEGLFAGSFDVYTLGRGGSVTLGFENSCVDGPGADLIVSENPFFISDTSHCFVEAMFVEISSDDVHWIRFPNTYLGEVGPFSPFAGTDVSNYHGFAGVMPVLTNPTLLIDPVNVVQAGGDAFDLNDLSQHPDVLSGLVDLNQIDFVRLIDVWSGQATDQNGTVIWDQGLDDQASSDIDALTAVNNSSNMVPGRPAVDLWIDSNQLLWMRLADPNGFSDIKFGLQASINGLEFSFYNLLPYFIVTQITSTEVTLMTGPVSPGAVQVHLKVSAVDGGGLTSGDAISLY